MTFQNWFNNLISEKNIDLEQDIYVQGPSGENIIPLNIVTDTILSTSAEEQAQIKNVLVRIDFMNGDIVDYFKHLAQAIAI